jgi:hypothetical protein
MPEAAAETAPTTAPAAPEAETSGDAEIAAALAVVEAESGETQKEAAEETPKEGEEAAEEKKEEKPAEEAEPEGAPGRVWAAVRKREQKFQKAQKEFEAKQRAWDARAQEIDQRFKAIAERERLLEEDPVGYLTKKGLTFDDLARRHLNDGKATPEEAARRAAAQQGEAAKAQEERLARLEAAIQNREADAKLKEYKVDVKRELAGDDLELLRGWPDAESEVLEFADKWARTHKEVLTPREASLKLQTVLKQQLSGLSSNQAVRSLLLGGSTQPKQEVRGQSQAPRGSGASPKTLTNNLAATPPADEPDFDSLSEEEQIQIALRLAQVS